MSIKLKDLLRLPSLKRMKLLAGENGLDRIVTWAYVCQMNSFSEWLQGGELVFFTGIGMQTDEGSLSALVRDGNEKHCAGLVFFEGEYIREIPSQVIELANQLEIPLFSIPWEVKLVDITKETSTYIIARQKEQSSLREWVKEVLSGSADAAAGAFSLNPESPYQVALLNVRDGAEKDTGGTKSEAQGVENFYSSVVQDLSGRYGKEVLCVPLETEIVLIVSAKKDSSEASKVLDYLCGTLMERFQGIGTFAGCGRPFPLGNVKKSYADAQKALKIALSSPENKAIVRYEDMGVYRLFFEIANRGELRSFYDDVMGPIIQYDKQNNTEFVKTLGVFFDNKLNHNKTAQALFIHRNSLIYRINRIEEILARDLKDPTTLIELQLCILIGRFLSDVV